MGKDKSVIQILRHGCSLFRKKWISRGQSLVWLREFFTFGRKSALPDLIGGFVLGPVGAVEIIAVKVLLKLVFKGTSSMFTGEVQKFLLCTAYALPAVLYYQKHRTKRGAAIGLVLGTICGVIVAVLTNVFLIFPAYMALYGMDWAAIVQMCTAVNPWITNVPTMVAFSIVPFNVISFSVTSILAMLLYKKISVPLKKFALVG